MDIWFSNQRQNSTSEGSHPKTHYSKYSERNHTRRSSFPFSDFGAPDTCFMLLLAEKRKRAVADKKGEVKKKSLFVLISWRNETDVDSFIQAASVASQNHVGRTGLPRLQP